jgi:predicted tellurium resistance membrane protein TerC
MYKFVMILTNSIRAEAKIDDPIFKNRFKNISRASFFGLIMIVLFAIDSLFAGVTIYSLTGWVSLIFTCYFLYKGYI